MSADFSTSTSTTAPQTTLAPVARPLNLIPVTLKEAALDSPTFRATSLHFAEQIELIERWLDGYVRASAKLVGEVGGLEDAVNKFLSAAVPPTQGLSEAVLDHDYTLLALRRYGEGARAWWDSMLKGVKKYEWTVIEPIKAFLNTDLKNYKDARRTLEATQKTFDHVISRYLAQSKTKEASSLREDAFQLHEARKAYLKASMDYCISAPNVRVAVDKLVVRVFAEQMKEMKGAREANTTAFSKWNAEVERVRGWSREMENSERAFKRELLAARRQIEDEAQKMTQPSRELEDYAASTVPYLGTGASTASAMPSPAKSPFKPQEGKGEKQGWLFMKTSVGKPARTIWSRRWFYIKNGIFGWLIQGAKSGGVEESERIGVLLCSVRPAFQEERRFCLEVKTKDTSIILQAEMQNELSEWIGVFEIAKRKALEDPASTEGGASAVGGMGVDPAFAITPPIAPEFAAKPDAPHAPDETPAPGSSALDREATFGPALSRSSFDVSAQPSTARRVMSLEREPGEGNREHAARIIQKLDLHKRSTNISQATQASSGPSSGIAGLIASSHNILSPIGTGSGPVTPVPAGGSENVKRSFSSMAAASTLAPSTLANPPAPTNLSHTAVIVSGERGIGLSRGGDGAGMPSGIMANLWGSSNWGYVNRLGPDPPKREDRASSPVTSPLSTPAVAPGLVGVSQDDVGIMDGMGETNALGNPMASEPNLPTTTGLRHRKTLSVADGAPLAASLVRQTSDQGDEYPPNYPLALKAQQAQFRMLFPSVPRREKVVLVFRATWNPNEQQEFPGRVYVTPEELYFYSNHLGLVLITGASLSNINEVTAAPGRDCDFLYLHLQQRRPGTGGAFGTDNDDEVRRITVKVFLEPLRLLQRRLNYLVHNASSDSPAGIEEVVRTLIKMEVEELQRSSSVESWEDVRFPPDSPQQASAGASRDDQRAVSGRRERNMKASLRIDGSLLYDTPGSGAGKTGREVQKFKLPGHPVVYAPSGMQASISRDFGVSAKALFHVVFGDKSAVWQRLYCNRWADSITQTPWAKRKEDGDGAHWIRNFASKGTPMNDEQKIDIYNDHLCYVVTNTKVPWKLPYSDRFTPTTKIVITHTAKSRCKLAIFQSIEWTKAPSSHYIRRLVEKQAFNSLEADALDLSNVAMDQVAKLGHHSKTNRAIEIFGAIGQQTEVPVLDTNAMTNLGGSAAAGRVKGRRPLSLARLVVDDALQRLLVLFELILELAMTVATRTIGGLVGLLTGHTLLVGLLVVSGLYNGWYGYRDGVMWWQEKSAIGFMSRVGVRPDPMIGRAIWLRDVEELVQPPTLGLEGNANATAPWLTPASNEMKTCRTTFADVLASSSSSEATALTTSRSTARLHRTRSSLASYRHDLLVALRVVNRVERDVVQAEYEQHVRAEAAKCARVDGMLRKQGRNERQKKDTGKQEVSDLEAELGEEFVEYCRSCRRAVEEVRNGMALVL